MTEPKDVDGSLPGYPRYIRRLYGQPWFPKLDSNGLAYTPGKAGARGWAAKQSQNVFRTEDALTKHLTQYFPQRAVHTVTEPEYRANLHKSGGQSDLFGRQLSKFASAAAYKKAASEFEVPSGTRILMVIPDLFDRDILSQHPQFCYKFKDPQTSKTLTGIKTPCPWCLSNEHVHVADKTGYQANVSRSIACYRTRIPIVTGIAKCSNPDCSGNPDKATGDSSDKVSKHSFQLNTARVWANYPLELRLRYAPLLYTEAADGDNNQIFVSQSLCHEVLKDDTMLSKMEREMVESFQRQRTLAMAAYGRYIHSQTDPTNNDNNQHSWPAFNTDNYDRLFTPPSNDKLGRVFDKCFELVLPYLRRDLFSRFPGKCIKWDATFDYASKTTNDPFAEEEINALCIVFGQHGHILSWAFAESEQGQVYQRLSYFLRKRCDRLGKSDEVLFAVSDVCCEGLRNPKDHWIVSMWPNIERAPYKDLMHGQKKIFDATRGHSHELHRQFTADVRDSCMLWDRASQEHVFELYKKREEKRQRLHAYFATKPPRFTIEL
jgi:hypothetical protein